MKISKKFRDAIWPAWIPLMIFPPAAIAAGYRLAPWCFMWVLSASIFFGCKWQTWWDHPKIPGATIARDLGYLFAWPGMDAESFLDPNKHALRAKPKEWIGAIARTGLGIL